MPTRAPDFSQQINDYEPCVRVGAIHPVPSMVLMVKYRNMVFPVTFDNGATVSFLRADLARALGLKFEPNGQLASLADSRYRIKSLGEVNFIVTEKTTGKALLRMRALIMKNLAVPCYGGQTFQLDNCACADISTVTISLHGGRFLIYQGPYTGPPAQPPPRQSIEDLGPPVPPPMQSVGKLPGLKLCFKAPLSPPLPQHPLHHNPNQAH